MTYAMVNGTRYEKVRLDSCCMERGTLVCGRGFRRAMRIVAFDGKDVILRNIRYPDLLEAVPVSQMSELYDQLLPSDDVGRSPRCGTFAPGECPTE